MNGDADFVRGVVCAGTHAGGGLATSGVVGACTKACGVAGKTALVGVAVAAGDVARTALVGVGLAANGVARRGFLDGVGGAATGAVGTGAREGVGVALVCAGGCSRGGMAGCATVGDGSGVVEEAFGGTPPVAGVMTVAATVACALLTAHGVSGTSWCW